MRLAIARCGEYQIGHDAQSPALTVTPSPNPASAIASPPVEWRIGTELVSYPAAMAAMEARVAAIRAGTAPELVWLLEHPPLYTAGTSARPGDLLQARFPVYAAGRGGQYTYHGPGQRVGYVMLDLKARGPDLRRFVQDLEEWLIRTLARCGVKGERREGRVGIWVARGDGCEDKIGAIGVRVRQWVSFHGVSLNLDPDLDHFSGIVPCGIADGRFGVTSLAALGVRIAMPDLDDMLRAGFEEVFGTGRARTVTQTEAA
jgi:lipoyl(octanoyl) transferase